MSKKNEHKPNVPELRFPEFSGEWEEKRLGDYAYIKGRLGWKGLKQEEYVENGYAHLIASKHIKNGYIMWSSTDQINEFRYKESLEIGLEENDIIFSKDGSLGNPAIIKEMPKPATINSTMMLVRLDKELVSPYFFYQILLSNQFQRLIHLKVSGSSIPHLFQADMKQFQFFSPSLREQKKIGEFFSKIDRQIELEEKKLALLEEQKKGYMQKIFSQELRFKDENGNEYPKWKEYEIDRKFNFFDKYRRPIEASKRIKGIYPYYGATGIIDFVDDYIFDGEYILIGEDGANIISRNSPLVYITRGKIWVNNHAHILQPKNGNTYYYYTLLDNVDYSKYNTGTAQPKLNIQTIKKIKCKFSENQKEQNKIGHFFEKMDFLIKQSYQKIERLASRKKVLLQRIYI
ncbi:restriction endonuclease subunit S [Staphylococcus simulans]|uniref:restriction endonuclease subunit S n=1 Tax=Staphylococcus simulans TaxID=1286 RepID=UPI000D1E8931|nr:restriction endonuclease subunit S [Staphylococcus simulans]PTJ20239.1 restriction endonuclease subunit S [Staphylococcus simulans]